MFTVLVLMFTDVKLMFTARKHNFSRCKDTKNILNAILYHGFIIDNPIEKGIIVNDDFCHCYASL